MRNAACAAVLAAGCAAAALGQVSSSHAPGLLRVGLWTLWHDRTITVAPADDGAATLRMCSASKACISAPFKQQTEIRAVGSLLALGKGLGAAFIEIGGPVTLGAHGESLTLRNPVHVSARDGVLILSVTLPVESYVERVVASESGPDDTAESLKALAIVVRSFALHQAHGHGDYDLCDSTHCQLLHWGGGANRVAAHAAALATAGETLWFHGQRAQAWFHQNCGGRTASPQEVWPAAGKSAGAHGPMPWLASRVDPYCSAGGTREWSTSLSLDELTGALAAAGLVRPGWKSLSVARRGESGRAVTLKVGSSEVSAEDFRLVVGRALGWNKILSNWFEVSAQENRFFFHGRGSGHGVGLCQVGAAAMGAAGRDAGQILAQYFPGAALADEASGLAWQARKGQGFALESLAAGDAVYLPELAQALAEAEARSGLLPTGGITVRAFRSTPAFREATLAPGWVAAFTEGNWIGTQPLATLQARKLLAPVLRHEFLHALVEGQAAPGTPLWLREGLVEAWADAGGNASSARAGGASPGIPLDQIDRALARARSEAQAEAAHLAAAWNAQRLLDRYGRAQVLTWLRSSLPATALSTIR